jgi:hypothetical protein
MRHVTGTAVMAVLLVTGSASAQVVPPLAEVHLKPGAKVAITDEHGDKISGRFAGLDTERITIGVDGELRHMPVGQILRVEEVDDLRNGMLIGLGIGVAIFAVEAIVARSDGFELTAAGYLVIGSIYGGLGAGAGAGIDALVGGDRTIYRRGGSARLSVVPTVRRGRTGVAVALSW